MHLTPREALHVLPDKYRYLAMDGNGQWHGYCAKPQLDRSGKATKWFPSTPSHIAININIQSDTTWDQSLLSKELTFADVPVGERFKVIGWGDEVLCKVNSTEYVSTKKHVLNSDLVVIPESITD